METRTQPSAPQRWHVPRLAPDARIIGGVAAGVAEELGVAPVVVRAAMLVLATTGWGVVCYGIAWGALALYGYRNPTEAGVARSPKGANSTTRLLGVGLILLGLLTFFRTIDFGFNDSVVWPATLLALGAVVAWDRGVLDGDGQGRRRIAARIAIGLGFAVAGIVVLASSNLDRSAAFTAIGAIVVVAAGIGVVLGPWIYRTLNALAEERKRRIRSEERADVAAHLHDSVLQTLALIQRQSSDPQAMVSLARQQERELRDWLFTDESESKSGSLTLRRAIGDTAAEVEQLHHIPIEVVVVGDIHVGEDDRLIPMIAAAREAMINASRHSGSGSVDVFAEVNEARFEVFVRDTGRGFDPTAIAEDRHGLADSVVGRMQRVGGAATIDTVINEGTEIVLTLKRESNQ